MIDTAKLAQEAGLYTVYVSNSYISDEALELVAPYIDVLCSDIKSMRDDFYQEICRPATVAQVLHCIKKPMIWGFTLKPELTLSPVRMMIPKSIIRLPAG